MAYCPVCATTLQPEPMNRGDEKVMTKPLIAYLKGKTDYDLIFPNRTRGTRSQLISQGIVTQEC